MEDLTLTISAPITEWCGDCDYQASKSLNGYSGKCPECGSNRIYSHVKKEKVFSVRVTQGRFGVYLGGGLTEPQYQYSFTNTPIGDVHVISDDDYDYGCPFQTLEALMYANDVSNSGKVKIKALGDAVFGNSDWKEDQERKIANNRRLELERELYTLNSQFGFYENEAEVTA